jgi:phosphomannomutase
MDDNTRAACSSPAAYRCPGQSYTIDRVVHLARLAAFYPACLRCEHRHDTGGLSPLQLRNWQQVERRAGDGPRPGGEGFLGATAGDVDRAVVGRMAGALAASLWRREESRTATPTVLVGTDGNWTTADFVPAACRALQLAGCRALEIGAVTSACLATAACHLRAEGALWVGNSSGAPHATNVKFWHAAGRPSSSPGRLDAVFDGYESTAVRPKRRGGRLQRFAAEEVYLPTLAGLFHGLRPLVFVLDTACHALVRYWRGLNVQSACRMIPLRSAGAASRPGAADRPPRARRVDAVACEVLAEGAHFGIWIDGDGEVCQLVDERGVRADACAVFMLLAGYACRQQPGAAIVLEPDAGAELQGALERIGARVFRADATRQAVCERMEATAAAAGGGPSGRYWFSGPPPVPDALLSLSLLISLLSQSDRPLSEVLDAARAGG